MAKRGAKGSARSEYGPMPSESRLEAAGSEMKENPPSVLATTRRKFGAKRAESQRVAILMNKARRGQ